MKGSVEFFELENFNVRKVLIIRIKNTSRAWSISNKLIKNIRTFLHLLPGILRIGEFNVDTITGKVSKGSFDPQHDLG